MIIKNEIPLLEYDDTSPEVISADHEWTAGQLPEKCLFVLNNIQMARRNARNNKLEAEFICDDTGRYMQALAKEGQNFDVIILDPPRAGSTLPSLRQQLS